MEHAPGSHHAHWRPRFALRAAHAALMVVVLLGAPLVSPAASPASPPAANGLFERVRQAALVTYVHGMTEAIAVEEVGPDGVPALRRLLADRDFPRRDNVVAMLGFLGGDEDARALTALLQAPPAPPEIPEEDRALLLAPQSLGQIASRGSDVALQTLLEMTAHGARGGVLSRAANHGQDPHALREDLLAMALRGLAYAGAKASEARLLEIARGRIEPLAGERALNAAAWSALDLQSELRTSHEPAPGTRDAGAEPPVNDGLGTLDTQGRVHDLVLTAANHAAVPSIYYMS